MIHHITKHPQMQRETASADAVFSAAARGSRGLRALAFPFPAPVCPKRMPVRREEAPVLYINRPPFRHVFATGRNV
jgi:hypothetical protein